MRLFGVDFTSAPSRRKAITIAEGVLHGACLRLEGLTALQDFPSFESWLRQPGPWLGAFDFPFSLPRELIQQLGWPQEWPALVRHVAGHSRQDLREQFQAFCNSRPAGGKFAHRKTDLPAGSSSPMKWVNPPVAYMLHAGAPRLLDAGVTVYSLHPGDPQRLAFEAYPGLVARSITRQSYKSDEKRKQTEARTQIRELLLSTLETEGWRALKLDCGPHRAALLADASGDLLDAALCLMAAGWAWQRRDAAYGLPEFDALEGWILGA